MIDVPERALETFVVAALIEPILCTLVKATVRDGVTLRIEPIDCTLDAVLDNTAIGVRIDPDIEFPFIWVLEL